MSDRTFVRLTAAITLLGATLRVWGIAAQPASPDDLSAAITAINFMENGQPGPTMWNHPALRNILMYLSMNLFGPGVVGVKIWGMLFGTLCVPLMALVGKRLVGPAAAIIAAFLWALDPLAIDYSRQAINDIYLAFFPLSGIYCGLRFREKGSPWWLIGAGIFFGFGLASKWSAFFQMICMAGFLLFTREENGERETPVARNLFVCVALGLLPVAVYLLTFLPWFQRGYGIDEWPSFQKAMYQETKLHQGYQKTLEGDHWAYEWFVVPVSYVEKFFVKTEEGDARREPTLEENVVILLAAANPLVWLLVLPAAIFLVYRGSGRRDSRLLFLAALFFVSYAPLALAHRPIWVDSALIVLPYALLAVAWMLWDVFGATPLRRRVLGIYIVVVALIAVPQYALVTGKGFSIPPLREYLIRNYHPDHGR